MKKLFGTKKRAVISSLCIAAVILAVAAGTSTVVVGSSLIGKTDASEIALHDAGLSQSNVSDLTSKLDFDDGHFQYEVNFCNNGTEYEYVIQAKDGNIIARDIDDNRNASDDTKALNQMKSETAVPSENDGITLDEAKAAALADANLSESDVTFTKISLDDDKQIQVYDIEFYTSDTEYAYEIRVSDGSVYEKDIEVLRTKLADSSTIDSDNNYIGVDRAKEIALNHANMNEADVKFSKAKLEKDDGITEYEIKFYSGKTEYEYTIDAVSGDILESDVDYDD